MSRRRGMQSLVAASTLAGRYPGCGLWLHKQSRKPGILDQPVPGGFVIDTSKGDPSHVGVTLKNDNSNEQAKVL